MTPLQRGFLATIIAAGLAALALFACRPAHAQGSCPSGQFVTGITVTTTCSGGVTPPPVTCTPPQVLQGGVCVTPVTPPPTCVPPQVLNAAGNACVDPAPPPTGDVATSCIAAGFPVERQHVIDMPWARFRAIPPVTTMGMFDVIVVRFTTPAVANEDIRNQFVAAEYSSSTSTRDYSLSLVPCAFAKPPALVTNSATTAGLKFVVGTGVNFPGYPAVPPATTAYINIKNPPSPGCSINGVCDIFIDFYPLY